ncbi:MAG TPA: HlyD family secretion protein [Acetobacteraceae bacterium]|nr:HlyD family secretion protein [Acetobacteraceae bacterium]
MSQATTASGSARVAGEAAATQVRRRRRNLLRPILMIGGVLAVVAASAIFWLEGGTYVSSDDSYVEADQLPVSTDVSGIVADVAVREGETVTKGQVLYRLDPRKFEIALAGAKADLAQTALMLRAMQQDYQRMLSEVASAEARLASDQADLARFGRLVASGGVPRAQYDDARFKAQADLATVDALKGNAAVQLAKLNGMPDAPVTSLPQYQAAEAKVAETQREFDHSVVRAPFDGIVTQVSKLQPGMYLPAGTAAFGLVSDEHFWVTANPKETELTWVRPGNPATVTVDTYPGRVWHGSVESISPAVGSAFSLLPAENSSGNWVKVVQRIPLRVRIDREPGDPPLRAGMSVEVSIDTGHRRTLADLW